MKATLHLDEKELREALAEALSARSGVKVEASSVAFNVDREDRTDRQIVTATARVDLPPRSPK